MQIVPLQATPSQIVTVSLSNQTCQIKVYQKAQGLFMDLYVNNSLVIGGVVCEDRNRIVRSAYLGFVGDFAFIDSQAAQSADGTVIGNDPTFDGLGPNGRYALAYLTPADLDGRP